MKTVAQKMGVKENSKAHFMNGPPEAIEGMGLPDLSLSEKLIGEFDYIHLFVEKQSDLTEFFPTLKTHLTLKGMLWVSWPKQGGLGTDLSLHKVIQTGYSFGLVESTNLSINEVWSGLKFTHPKKGKVYRNSHAELKERTTNR